MVLVFDLIWKRKCANKSKKSDLYDAYYPSILLYVCKMINSICDMPSDEHIDKTFNINYRDCVCLCDLYDSQ